MIEFEARIKGFQEHTHSIIVALGVELERPTHVSVTDLETFRAQYPEPTPLNSIQTTHKAIEKMLQDND